MDDSKNEGVLLRFLDPEGAREVVLEDDGRVAYAYLIRCDDIVSDVWLYNVAPTPDAVDWDDRNAMPFLNPKEFCEGVNVGSRLSISGNVQCKWYPNGVDVYWDGVAIARMEHGAKPGWSRFASRPGPLARPLLSPG